MYKPFTVLLPRENKKTKQPEKKWYLRRPSKQATRPPKAKKTQAERNENPAQMQLRKANKYKS